MVLLGCLCVWAASVGLRAATGELTREGQELFEKKIRPVLVERCYECHSIEAKKIKGGLVLDSREGWMRGGDTGPVIVPGDPEKSRLMQALRYKDEDFQMPPKEKLPDSQIADFEAWIRLDAPGPRAGQPSATPYTQISTNHWAFRAPKEPPISKLKDRKWPKDLIDHFILADLEERKLKPAPMADKRTLIRRATFDLIGLPPKPEDIEAFLKDASPQAFAKVVDRLLDSPHFGERWGRHWLDVVRYADSNGLEANIPYPNAWRYRDYVMASFNNDKPFDRFIREQIAGDLLPAASDEQRFEQLTATGLLVLGPKALGEPNQEKLVMDVVDDQIDVTTRAFLGLTASCARCHDHKFDPIPTRDYYALAGIFKSTLTLSSGARQQGPNLTRWLERPLVTAEKAKEIEENEKALNKLTELRRIVEECPGGIQSSKLPGIVVDNSAALLTGRWKTSMSTNFVDKDYQHDANSQKGMMSARFVPNLPHTGAYEVLVAYTASANRATNVPISLLDMDGMKSVTVNQTLPPRYRNAFSSLGTFQFQAGTNGSVEISNTGTKGFVIIDAVQFVPIDEWKLELAALEASKNQMVMTGDTPLNANAPAMLASILGKTISRASPEYEELAFKMQELREKISSDSERTMAVQEGSAQNSRIHIRGEYDKLGEEVPRGFIRVVGATKSSSSQISSEKSGRLELAHWIASPENPLTARVAVNRIWLHLFGRGLVETPDNFGLLGEKPTHPELLDHLARRFMADGWSFKKMIRAITLTSAYQMSCEYQPKAYAKDPDNRNLWRMNRRRLEAEALRDAILAVSGQLDLTRGGSLLATNNLPMNNPLAPFPQVSSNRRSVYLPVLRNNVPDMFQVFDFVDPHTVSGKRHITTAAPQALFMMNSEFVQEQSRKWAEALLARSPSDDARRVNAAYQQAFGRPAKTEEVDRVLRFIERFQQTANTPESSVQAGRLPAWQSFCQALLASTEFRFLN